MILYINVACVLINVGLVTLNLHMRHYELLPLNFLVIAMCSFAAWTRYKIDNQ